MTHSEVVDGPGSGNARRAPTEATRESAFARAVRRDTLARPGSFATLGLELQQLTDVAAVAATPASSERTPVVTSSTGAQLTV